MKVRNVVLILRECIVDSPLEVCFQYLFQICLFQIFYHFCFKPMKNVPESNATMNSMSQNSPLVKRWQERLYMEHKASQLVAEQENNFHFPKTSDDNDIMIKKTYMGCPHFQFCSLARSLTTLLTNSRGLTSILPSYSWWRQDSMCFLFIGKKH